MNRVLFAGTAALALSASAAFAGGLAPPIVPLVQGLSFAEMNCPVVQPVVTSLQAQGFTRIEVGMVGATQARFVATRGGQTDTFLYDCVSGNTPDGRGGPGDGSNPPIVVVNPPPGGGGESPGGEENPPPVVGGNNPPPVTPGNPPVNPPPTNNPPPVNPPPTNNPPPVNPPPVNPPPVNPPPVNPPERCRGQGCNNGFGNGDQAAPGNSGPHNNAENATDRRPYPGNSNSNGNNDDNTPGVNDNNNTGPNGRGNGKGNGGNS